MNYFQEREEGEEEERKIERETERKVILWVFCNYRNIEGKWQRYLGKDEK
jgi:hypothetical protein